MNKAYFANKSCAICKRPAKYYRVMGNFSGCLCDSKDCDFKVQVKEKFFEIDQFANIKLND
jgi:hypothetical protein